MSEYMFHGMDSYDTPENHPVALGFKLMFKSRWYFYLRNFGTFIRSGRCAAKGKLDKDNQIYYSNDNIRLVEDCGSKVHLRGLDNLRALEGRPVVIIGNHMSLLETASLHAVIREHVDFSFVVKESLLHTLYIKDILNSMKAIGVSRTNPREDLKKVLTEGKRVLSEGRSMIVFPQSTRTREFDREQFNSIGVKLAKSAGVPVVPMALKTDFLENGKLIRDLGPLKPERDVYFEFGKAMEIEGNGQAQQQYVEDFIAAAFERWKSEEK
ncbi:MAG: 1-acyl-sn-glycerol-3-phosphate acyltransferase [Lentisphaeria bacterium]|nr:1-acyl-sn-glycerol-3-phosphate acyltransferase [Lentisphaerota bacterium]MBR2625718.1 1-acyl-sn-glycerol-3-phosphate acyltransferase [Lentisphaeria bacterium]